MILMICQALEDILKGVEFEGSEATFCEFHSLGTNVSGRLNGGATSLPAGGSAAQLTHAGSLRQTDLVPLYIWQSRVSVI